MEAQGAKGSKLLIADEPLPTDAGEYIDTEAGLFTDRHPYEVDDIIVEEASNKEII